MRAVCQRGSQRAGLVWLGTLLYLVYAFVVYAVAVHFNYLFLVYVAALGLSAWAVILHANRLRGADMQYPPGRPLKVAAGVIIGIGVLFAGLWLSELVPALISGKVPVSLTEAGLWVNPIHVIDLSVVLPGFIVAGVAALQRREHGLFWLAPWLVFSALMGSSIIAAMVLMRMAGIASPAPAMAMVSLVIAASLLTVWGYLSGRSLSGPETRHTLQSQQGPASAESDATSRAENLRLPRPRTETSWIGHP